MQTISRAYGQLLYLCFSLACLILLAMTVMICADVFTRNTGLADLSWSNEISETMLSAMTMLAAPWLLRQGQHIRVDILLQALPARAGWACEWASDLLGFACSVALAWHGWLVTHESYLGGGMITKTLVTPEWWGTAPWVLSFSLLSVEFLFRMDRLRKAEHRPRHDAVSAS
ncbi:TRAP transporter small permease [Pigmentiphaga sp. YJ18]|uniref:TRAP transporter small permease n=1 Tax=unclassified Pigmentiphaga TaxID=2626614 RepID=UPI001EDD8BB9|nr:TRAP transporter small permease [Pigmentiphaga sp. H8]